MALLRAVALCPLAVEAKALRGLSVAGVSLRVERTGMGPAAVSEAVEALARERVDLVALFGVAGGLARTPRAPRVVRVLGREDEEPHRPRVSLWRSGRSDWTTPVSIVSQEEVVHSVERKRALAAATGAQLVDCESWAFARACERAQLRWAVVRGVSDGPDEALPRQAVRWVRPDGATAPGRTLADLVRGRVSPGAIAQLAQRTSAALREARGALTALLAQEQRERSEGAGALAQLPQPVLLVGGMFDPPHVGHLRCASEAALAAGCGSICFVPASQAPLRGRGARAGDLDRFDMLLAGIDELGLAARVSGVELARFGVNYTVETLAELRRLAGEAAQLRLFIGADQAAQFHKWRSARQLLAEAPPVVALRPPFARPEQLLEAMAPHWSDEELARWRRWVVPAPLVEASSSAIRAAISREGPGAPLARRALPESVRAIVAARGLYRAPGDADGPEGKVS